MQLPKFEKTLLIARHHLIDYVARQQNVSVFKCQKYKCEKNPSYQLICPLLPLCLSTQFYSFLLTMTVKKKSFIFMAAALAENGGIGYKNGLPWSIPGDWEYFENVTTKSYGDQKYQYTDATEWSNVVVMGRLSYESRPMLREPLANRYNIIVSRNPDYKL